MMQKILFLEFAELKQGDGLGPKFEAGKAYWLSPDQADRWRGEGVAEDAPDDMPAENEPDHYRPAPHQVKLVKVDGGHDVVGPADHKFNAAPLAAADAELLRAGVLAGEVKGPLPGAGAASDDGERLIPIFVEEIDGGRKIASLAAAKWPAITWIPNDRLVTSDGPPATKLKKSRFEITVVNGSAVYQLGARRDDGRVCRLVESKVDDCKLHAPTCAIGQGEACNCDGWPPAPAQE